MFTFKHGFPLGTGEAEACTTALDAAAAHLEAFGQRSPDMAAQVVRTAAHDAAGEFLVRVDGTVEHLLEEAGYGPVD
jgi:hypothetical protein